VPLVCDATIPLGLWLAVKPLLKHAAIAAVRFVNKTGVRAK
jgi:hypothetical protein